MSNNAEMDLEQKYNQLARAMKLGFCAILSGISFFNLIGAIALPPEFERIFHDMLGGKALPGLTNLVLNNHLLLILLSLAFPVAGLIVCRFAKPDKAITIVSGLMLMVFVQMVITGIALYLPFISIIHTMSSGSGG